MGRLSPRVARNPDAAALAACRFRHEPQLVFAGNAGGVDLDELAVGVVCALLEDGRLRGAGADDGVGAFAEDGAVAAGGENNGVGRKDSQLHCSQVQRGDAAGCAFGVEHGGEKLPAFVFLNLAFGLVAANLLVERIEQLLAGGCARESRAVIERAAEAAEVEQAFRSAVEGNAHAVEQVDDGRRGLAHGLDGRLVGEKVAAVDGVVEVLVGGVAFALEILGGVDAALRADRVRTLDGDDRKQVDVPPASAILMTAASPASPPPTTMILGAAMKRTSFQRSGVEIGDQGSEIRGSLL